VWGRPPPSKLSLSDNDFKSASHVVMGEDWPISYAYIAPFLRRREK